MDRAPGAAELYDIYAPSAFLAGKPEEACDAAAHRLAFEHVTAFNFLLAATLHLHAHRRQEAANILHAGAVRFPDDAEIKSMMDSLDLLHPATTGTPSPDRVEFK